MKLDDPRAGDVIPLAFSEEEIDFFESRWTALSPVQPADFMAIFEKVETVRMMELTTAALVGCRRDFLSASAVHSARQRPELAAKYRRLAETCDKVLKESAN